MTDPNKPHSRRQRIYDLVKNTKDVYIPSISHTISQLASDATSRALSDSGGAQGIPGAARDLTGAEIVLYPHFTRKSKSADESGLESTVFFTQVHGWVYSTSGSTRKKKLVLTLARQLAKSRNATVSDATTNEINEQINTLHQHDENAEIPLDPSKPRVSPSNASTGSLGRSSTSESDTSSVASSVQSSKSDLDGILKERISKFLNRSLGNLELTVCVGGQERDDLKVKKILSDENGNFNVDVPTSFKPSYIQVATTQDEKIFVFKNSIFPGNSRYGVISDIDDTIKKTGVCGDRRQLFRNTFSDHISTWEIPGASDCYRFFSEKLDIPIFYVSNSPYQLFSNLEKFFDMFSFPIGSMYLKKYTGNLLNSMMEPSHTRKKAPLARILTHYKDKKFFLIGDTGEQDLEAYVDTARLYPERVQGIFLRVAEGSMRKETLSMLNEILTKRHLDHSSSPECQDDDLIDLSNDINDEHLLQIAKDSVAQSSEILDNLVDLEKGSSTDFFANNKTQQEQEILQPKKRKSPPPPVPKKPDFLKAAPKSADTASPKATISELQRVQAPKTSPITSSLPVLPRRPVPTPPALPQRKPCHQTIDTNKNAEHAGIIRSDQIPASFSDRDVDEWISRLLASLIILRRVNPNIKLKFFTDFSEVKEEIVKIIESGEDVMLDDY